MTVEKLIEWWRKDGKRMGALFSHDDAEKFCDAYEALTKSNAALVRVSHSTMKECEALRAKVEGLEMERNQLLELTRTMTEHPDDYDGPCECSECMSYGSDDGDGS